MRLEYPRTTRLARLTDELAQRPELAPLATPGGLEARFAVSGRPGLTVVDLPDDVPRAVVDAVVAAHDPSPDPQPAWGETSQNGEFREQAVALVASLRAYLAAPSPTPAETVGALKLTIRGLLWLLRRLL